MPYTGTDKITFINSIDSLINTLSYLKRTKNE